MYFFLKWASTIITCRSLIIILPVHPHLNCPLAVIKHLFILSKCVRSWWSPGWMCVVYMSTITSRTPMLQTHRNCQSFPLAQAQGIVKAFLCHKYECVRMIDQFVQKLRLANLPPCSASLFSCIINYNKPTYFIEIYKINLLSFLIAVVVFLHTKS